MYKLTNFKLENNIHKLKIISIMRNYLNTTLLDAKLTVDLMLNDNYEIITKSSYLIADLSLIPNFTFSYNEIEDKEKYTLSKDTIKSEAEKWYDNLSENKKKYVQELAFSFVPGPAGG